MKVRTTFFAAVALSFLLPGLVLPAPAEARQEQSTAPSGAATQEQIPTAATQTTIPPQSAQPQGSAPLRVMVDKSLLINTTERLKRISVTETRLICSVVLMSRDLSTMTRSGAEPWGWAD